MQYTAYVETPGGIVPLASGGTITEAVEHGCEVSAEWHRTTCEDEAVALRSITEELPRIEVAETAQVDLLVADHDH